MAAFGQGGTTTWRYGPNTAWRSHACYLPSDGLITRCTPLPVRCGAATVCASCAPRLGQGALAARRRSSRMWFRFCSSRSLARFWLRARDRRRAVFGKGQLARGPLTPEALSRVLGESPRACASISRTLCATLRARMGCACSSPSKEQLLLTAATNGDVEVARKALDGGAALECLNEFVAKNMGGGEFSMKVSAQRAAPASHA